MKIKALIYDRTMYATNFAIMHRLGIVAPRFLTNYYGKAGFLITESSYQFYSVI